MAETKLKLSDEIKKDGLNEQVVTNKVEESTGKLLPNGGYPMHTFDDLKAAYSLYIHNESDQKMIEDAFHFVEKKHAGILRKSGEPYIHHLIEVAYIVATLQGGPVTIAAALLHDVVEDTETTVEDIERMFGEETARIVDSLTKIQRLKLSKRTQEEFEAEDHRKIFLGMAKDVRVIIIKLADRLHNLRTIEALKPERQHALAKETLEVFAPIAHRLGIYRVESELEDLSLKIEKPDEYEHISELLNEKIKNRKNALNQLKKKIADILYRQGFKFEIEARVKSIYSIYKKMFLKKHKFEDIYDVLALRIITETELNCYEILGIIHQNFTPIPGRFKDYIAMPKPNMYQSLHTSVIDGNSNIFEVQIRTKEMDEIAESGVAAHWRYKEGTHYSAKQEQKEIEEKLHWFRDFVSISKDKDLSGEDAQDYLMELTASYSKMFNEHNLKLLGGYSFQKFTSEGVSAGNTEFLIDGFLYHNLGSGAAAKPSVASWASVSSLGSYFARANYIYGNRYLFEATLRADGASNFSPKKRWGFFPSVALGWVMSEEKFMTRTRGWLSNLKWRFSYGQTGNSNVGNRVKDAYGVGLNYVIGNTLNKGVYASKLGNPLLTWETTSEFNVGLDLGFFNERVKLSAEYFNRRITDLLVSNKKLLSYNEVNVIAANSGATKSQGFELTLNTINFATKKFDWNTTLTLAHYNDRWDKRPEDWKPEPYQKENDPIRAWWAYESEGLLQIGEKAPAAQADLLPGQVKIKDQDNNGVINSYDLVYMDNGDPKLTFGLNN